MTDDKELNARLRDFEKVTVGDAREAADRIEQLVATNEALEAKLGYYNLLWQAYEGERPVEHLEEAVKNHSAVSDRLSEKLYKAEGLLEQALRYNSAMHGGAGAYNKSIKDFIAELKGESHD